MLLVALAATSCARPPRVALPESPALATTHRVIPAPVSVELSSGGGFLLGPDTTIVVTPGDERAVGVGRFLSNLIGTSAGPTAPPVRVASGATAAGSIHLAIGTVPAVGDEGYELTVTPAQVVITANEPAGLFYGAQTLRQLLPPFIEYEAVRPDSTRPVRVPTGTIVDRPRFAWRGARCSMSRATFFQSKM